MEISETNGREANYHYQNLNNHWRERANYPLIHATFTANRHCKKSRNTIEKSNIGKNYAVFSCGEHKYRSSFGSVS